MSHFAVIVTGEDVETQLEDFWEVDDSESNKELDERCEFNREISLKDAKVEFTKALKNNPTLKGQDLDTFMDDEHNFVFDSASKYYGYWYNPNSKWDWYSIGGRWTGGFKAKKGKKGELGTPGVMENKPKRGYYDSIKKGDIDFEKMGKEIIPFAILHEGEWYENGTMGYFGVVKNEGDQKKWEKLVMELLNSLPDDTLLTLVDCHI